MTSKPATAAAAAFAGCEYEVVMISRLRSRSPFASWNARMISALVKMPGLARAALERERVEARDGAEQALEAMDELEQALDGLVGLTRVQVDEVRRRSRSPR